MKEINLKEVTYDSKDFIDLCARLDIHLDQGMGGECNREEYKKYNGLQTLDYVVISYVDQMAVACGALRRYSDNEIEVKRVFVSEDVRRQGIGKEIIKQLQQVAKNMGYQRMILETGSFLEASVQLYESVGFHIIDNYGAYKDLTESICMAYDIE